MSSSPFPRPYSSPHPYPWLKLLGIGPDSSGFTGFSRIGGLPILAKDSDPGRQFGSDGESTRLSHQLTGPGVVERFLAGNVPRPRVPKRTHRVRNWNRPEVWTNWSLA